MQGGFYRYDLNAHVSYLAINSIYFNAKNYEDLAEATAQLAWI